jgi:rubrerythrin
MSEQTATDRLLELLDERGIEYEHERTEGIASYMHVTKWNTQDGKRCYYHEIEDGERPYYTNLYVEFNNQPTPEQAIAATVGARTCRMYRDQYGTWHCTECEKGADKISGNSGEIESWNDSWAPNFCPYCGAKVLSE